MKCASNCTEEFSVMEAKNWLHLFVVEVLCVNIGCV